MITTTTWRGKAACLIATAALAGCAANGAGAPGLQTGAVAAPSGYVSPIRSQADDFRATVAEGAVVGAIAGGLIGAIASGGDVRRTLIAAGAGGVAGAGIGYVVAGQKAEYARKEDAVDALVADARQRNEKLSRILVTTDEVIKKRRLELAELKAKNLQAADKLRRQQELISKLEVDQQAVEQAIENARANGEQLTSNATRLRQQFPDAATRPLDDMTIGFARTKQELDRKPADIKKIMSEARQAVGTG